MLELYRFRTYINQNIIEIYYLHYLVIIALIRMTSYKYLIYHSLLVVEVLRLYLLKKPFPTIISLNTNNNPLVDKLNYYNKVTNSVNHNITHLVIKKSYDSDSDDSDSDDSD